MSTTVELIQPVLGMDPYVLIELVPSPDGDDGPTVRIRAGGGITADEELASALGMTLVGVIDRGTLGPEWGHVIAAFAAMEAAAPSPDGAP